MEPVPQPLRFPGQYYDAETGLHYNRHRYYSPELGRYISADPIGQFGGPNLYPYVQNNPLNLVDPSGQVLPAVIAILSTPGGQALAVATVAAVAYGVAGTINQYGGGGPPPTTTSLGPPPPRNPPGVAGGQNPSPGGPGRLPPGGKPAAIGGVAIIVGSNGAQYFTNRPPGLVVDSDPLQPQPLGCDPRFACCSPTQ